METDLFLQTKYNLGKVERYILQLSGQTISVLEFIDIIEEIIPFLDIFGTSFKSLKYELVKGSEVVQSRYESANFFDDLKGLIYYDNNSGTVETAEAVLWIYRCLSCFQSTLSLMLNARKHGYLMECLTPLVRMAYIYQFRSYHSWLDQHIFETLSRHCPSSLKVIQALKINEKESDESVFVRIASFEGTLKEFLSQLNDSLGLEQN